MRLRSNICQNAPNMHLINQNIKGDNRGMTSYLSLSFFEPSSTEVDFSTGLTDTELRCFFIASTALSFIRG